MQPRLMQWCGRVVRWERASRGVQVGLLIGAAVTSLWVQCLTAFGANPAVVIGLVLAAVVGCVGAGPRTLKTTQRGPDPVTLLILAIWIVGFPWLTQLPFEVISFLKSSWLQLPTLLLTCGLCSGLFLLTLPHFLLTQTLNRSESQSPTSNWGKSLGVGIALILFPTWVLPMTGAFAIAIAAAACLLALGVRTWLNERATFGQPSTGLSSSAPSPELKGRSLEVASTLALLIGATFATLLRMTSVLWLHGVYCTMAAVGGTVLGYAATQAVCARRSRRRAEYVQQGEIAPMAAALVLAALAGGLFLLQPWLMKLTLNWNADVSQGAAIVGMRSLLLALLAAPLGVVCRLINPLPDGDTARGAGQEWAIFNHGESTPVPKTTSRVATQSIDPMLVMCGVVGWCLSVWWGSNVATTMLVLIPTAIAVAVLAKWRLSIPFPSGMWRRVGALGALSIAICGLLSRHWYDSGLAAQLLFSTRTIQASRNHDRPETLTALDDTRLIDQRAGRMGELTFWKQSSELLVIRTSGVPSGIVSLNPTLVPQSSPEIVPAVVGLTTHSNPEHLLLVGVGSSATLTASLAFPLRSITCLEDNVALMSMIDSSLCPSAQTTLDDERVRWINTSPMLAAGLRGETYDVIIVNHAQPAAEATRGLLTRETFQRWSRSLNDGGVLCQRLQFADFGSETMKDIVAAMGAVFPEVVLWESGPGEVLLLGSNRPEPLFDEGVLARAGTPHVRRLLSQVGWDWTVPLSLLAMKNEQVREMVAGHAPASVRESSLACGMPIEVARWGNKYHEVRELFRGRMAPVASWFPGTEASEPISQRVADMNEQRRLIDEHPDHFWAYRRTLKDRLQSRPRSTIVQVKHEGWERQIDPEDARRKEYLTALGDAITQEHPTRESIREVEAFADPYDPLVSHFLHEEVARMLANLPQRNRADEFAHWMHAAYYGPPLDRSVGSVVEALALLCESNEAVPDPEQRWDSINGLLELMRQRWTLRSHHEKKSKYETVDAERSLRIAEQALVALQEQSAAIGVDPKWCEGRRQVLEENLIRPLRTYQTEQNARLRAAELTKQHKAQGNVLPEVPGI